MRSRRTRAVALPGIPALAVLLAFGVVVVSAAEKAPGTNGRIVFARFLPSRSSGDTPLFTANPDGSGQKQLPAAS